MSEVKRYTFDEICDSGDFNHEEEFVLHSDYEHLKTKLELTNKELGLNIKSHLNDICTLEKLKAQLEKAEAALEFVRDVELGKFNGWKIDSVQKEAKRILEMEG